jgi:hypothetical protein
MNWTIAEILSLRGLDAAMYLVFCLAGISLYYSMKYAVRSGR